MIHPDNAQHHHPRPPVPPPQAAERLVTVETQQEHDLLTGERVERIFVKLYVAARTSGLLAAISDRDFKTLCTLATYMDRDGYCYPSQDQLAKALGCTRQTANERLQGLAEFRFDGKPVMLIPKDQDHGERGKFSGKRYRILPISGLSIFDRHEGSTRASTSTVSGFADTVPCRTVSASTVSANPDTNKSHLGEQENEKQQHPQTPSASGKGSGSGRPRERVVVSSQLAQKTVLRAVGETRASQEHTGAAGDGPSPNGTGKRTLTDVFGLASLTNELIARGVSLQAAQHWIQQCTPEYVGELLAYHDWCKEHRPDFIHDHGAWLTASLKNPIDFPERYMRTKETTAQRAAQRQRHDKQQRMALLNEARQHAIPPEERVEIAQAAWAGAYEIAHRRRPTEREIAERGVRLLEGMREEAERFFAEHPELREIAKKSLTTDHADDPVGAAVRPSGVPV